MIDERGVTTFRDWDIILDQDSGATRANNLDVDILIDGAVVTFDSISTSYANLTKTKNRLGSKMTRGAVGRTFRLKWNTNATPAVWMPSSSTATQLSIYEINLYASVKELAGDVAHQL